MRWKNLILKYAKEMDEKEAAEHTVEIRVREEGKRFTVTAVSIR